MKKGRSYRIKLPKFASKTKLLAAKRRAANMARRIKARKAQL
jgi:hypothetical protein